MFNSYFHFRWNYCSRDFLFNFQAAVNIYKQIQNCCWNVAALLHVFSCPNFLSYTQTHTHTYFFPLQTTRFQQCVRSCRSGSQRGGRVDRKDEFAVTVTVGRDTSITPAPTGPPANQRRPQPWAMLGVAKASVLVDHVLYLLHWNATYRTSSPSPLSLSDAQRSGTDSVNLRHTSFVTV